MSEASRAPAPALRGGAAPLLLARDVVKRFAGVTALNGVSFELRPGEVHALCGENGAGKSTLIKLLAGVHLFGSYEGELRLNGVPLQLSGTRAAERAGIAVVHQELALIPEMSVAENLYLGRLPRRLGIVQWSAVYAGAQALLRDCEIELDPAAPVGALGIGKRQLVEIARALAGAPKLVVLDEPTAALAEREVAALLALVRRLRARGIACIYVSHKLEEVFAIADRITVLRDGQSVVTLDARATDEGEVIRHMVGRPLGELFPRRARTPGPLALRVEGLTVAEPDANERPPFLQDISFELRAGEVLGIGGLLGAGRSELLLHLFGAFGRRLRGQVELRGVPLEHAGPARALRAGLCLVSEDRRRHGLCLDQSIAFNTTLSSLRALARAGLIAREAELARAAAKLRELGTKLPGLDAPAAVLSGGNQQKVVLAKALLTEPVVLLLDEPTRGIDIGAKREIYALIERLTEQGMAVVLVSSELVELLALSDRIAMLHEGRIGGVFARAEATQERLMAAALGRVASARVDAPRGAQP